MSRTDLDAIRAHWRAQAKAHGNSHAASWSDRGVIEREIAAISELLGGGDRVLDVGCGNGFSSVRWAAEKAIELRGIDYTPELLDIARERVETLAAPLRGTCEFAIGDVAALDEPESTYDKVICVRVLINLGEWERQREALLGLARCVAPGGMLLLSEATTQGWKRLNKFRREWGLSDIPMPEFDNYLDQEQVTAALAGKMELIEVRNFASSYYVVTRVLKPLLAKMTGADIDVANADMQINRWGSLMPAAGDYGTQKLFVFRKPDNE